MILPDGLMIQGTTSDAGKSITVAGLCRLLHRRGMSVAPFKPQNMALNSAVTAEGGEIGRAQALQAFACDLAPHTDFNPVLLKPSSDQRSQVIIHGQVVSELEAQTFGSIKALAFDRVLESYRRLQQQYDVVLIEGAGSPAEINLRARDIANMGFAEAVNCPVVLISDIDRGGVFAHLVGTHDLLSPSEQNRIKGFIINKFRGSLDLLQSGLDWLETYRNKPVFGVLPYLPHLKLDAEDAIQVDEQDHRGNIEIKVPVLSRISNHTDFDPLRWHPKVNLTFVPPGSSLGKADLIIIPGSKNVRAELTLFRQQGWDHDLQRHLRFGGKVLGICGGYQMLGRSVSDPMGVESTAGSSEGLNLLPIDTELRPNKQLKQITGTFSLGTMHGKITGYEIHCGVSTHQEPLKSFSQLNDQFGDHYPDGAVSDCQQIFGTYIHGLFEHPEFLSSLLQWVSGERVQSINWNQIRMQELDRLADCFEEHLNIDALLKLSMDQES
ncbi:cobyric acid synthase [Pleionea litopenaei]|uniref:Cobyric acid synthase n=1 Tax=Pleionea litopenaei TaxID=3070815 RepID=A0AA51X5G7_9GAMM|nr:cobyric acid synthase [Pleionea sp. HL-JVS1]WMS86077.1 cobyric acid synthase [Pleionea sp. HL-JVS1]